MLSIFLFWLLVMHLETLLYNDFIHCFIIRYISLKYSKMETTLQKITKMRSETCEPVPELNALGFLLSFFSVWLNVQLMKTVDKTIFYYNNNYNMPWMHCVGAAALPDSCTRIQQRESEPWKPCALHQEWEEGSGLLAVSSPTALARAVFLLSS